ncbi:hypothetical protein [uncultured Mediterranean phage uvMED]|nr:hypothetical protein [uncultured Mediterranean phage uvMED]
MAKNQLMKLIENLDRIGSSLVVSGPSRAAKRTIRELQQEGPSWTGQFSNSYQIETPDGRMYKGDGQPGEPRPIKLPIGLLTGRQNIRGSAPVKDRAVTTISNFSEYAAEATDVVESAFSRPTEEPTTALGRRKFREGDGGRPRTESSFDAGTAAKIGSSMQLPSYRGLLGGGPPNRESSATADLDWFAMYVEGGGLDRAVAIEMDDLFTEL